MIEIKIPSIGESISEATIAEWLKKDGDYVERDEVIGELESEKASFELSAEAAGVLQILEEEGTDVEIGQVVAKIDETAKTPESEGSEGGNEEKEEADESEKKEADSQAQDEEEEATDTSAPKAVGKGIIEIEIPSVGESISEVTLINWTKEEGEFVERDEVICELESEKASFEVNAEESGALHQKAEVEEDLKIGQIVATIDTDVAPPAGSAQPKSSQKDKEKEKDEKQKSSPEKEAAPKVGNATPVASAMIADNKLKAEDIKGSGTSGKIVKKDVMAALENPGTSSEHPLFSREERREKMSRLRKTISSRLVEAKNDTAMLTTFNEVDMSKVKEIRNKYKKAFMEKHDVKLGFMSFFTKACCYALQDFPAVNAYIDKDELIYHEYCDVSIAVSTPKGLVVPVIRNAESLSMAGIEQEVVNISKKARNGKLSMEEMTGGTFTITNGGVFGSLMSTPILNRPQSAILGMHKIEERPVAENGKVVVKPMMYLALSYDHRVIDGKESVSFLVRVKELLEDPAQLLFGKDPVQSLLEM